MGQVHSSREADNTAHQNDEDVTPSSVSRRSRKQQNVYFGTHFLLGGERYEMAKPEVFLFGDHNDLSVLTAKPAQFPYSRQPISDPVRTLNALVNLRRDSLKLIRQLDDRHGTKKKLRYGLEFTFDCDSPCRIALHFFGKEFISNGQVRFLYKNTTVDLSVPYFFDVGAEQQFNQFVFERNVHNLASMNYEGGSYYPIIIELRTIDCGIEQVQLTMASIERSSDQITSFIIKPLRQKLVADGVIYLLQEIYGLENKDTDFAEENGSECIICLSDIRDTVILPCKHLCICNGCAETLRYKLNNCPICRSPFRALLQLKTMRVVSTISITDESASTQQTRSQTRYETMTLVEALNGPISHVQSCMLPTGQIESNTLSFLQNANRKIPKDLTDIQQVLIFNKSADEASDEKAVYIEMKEAGKCVITRSASSSSPREKYCPGSSRMNTRLQLHSRSSECVFNNYFKKEKKINESECSKHSFEEGRDENFAVE